MPSPPLAALSRESCALLRQPEGGDAHGSVARSLHPGDDRPRRVRSSARGRGRGPSLVVAPPRGGAGALRPSALSRPPFPHLRMSRAVPSQIGGFPIRLFAVVVGTVGLALPVLVVALAGLALDPPPASEWGGIGLFLVLAMAADFRPVPLDEEGNEVSLAFVFIIAELLLFGWRAAVPTAALSVLVPELARRRPPLRAAFNSAPYPIAATGAAPPLPAVDEIRS